MPCSSRQAKGWVEACKGVEGVQCEANSSQILIQRWHKMPRWPEFGGS